MNIIKHFITITTHKILVMKYCFKIGLYRQGLMHDMSKYSPTEFINGCMFYQGYRSPNNAEREKKGYSESWLHHKGRNKHHFEYWLDYSVDPDIVLEPAKMPLNYVLEMVMDRIAASMVYEGDKFTFKAPLEYYKRGKDKSLIHPDNKRQLEILLNMFSEKGETYTIKYIKRMVIKYKKIQLSKLLKVDNIWK